MRRSGPPPKPAKLKQLEGNPGHRPIPVEPELEPLGESPKWLNADARRAWERYGPVLSYRMGGKLVDEMAFACFCQAYSLAAKYGRALNRKGALVQHDASNRRARAPEMMGFVQACSVVSKMSSQFGFTPGDRARLFAMLRTSEVEGKFAGGHGVTDDDLLNGNWTDTDADAERIQ